jgi:hypothetical protein
MGTANATATLAPNKRLQDNNKKFTKITTISMPELAGVLKKEKKERGEGDA